MCETHVAISTGGKVVSFLPKCIWADRVCSVIEQGVLYNNVYYKHTNAATSRRHNQAEHVPRTPPVRSSPIASYKSPQLYRSLSDVQELSFSSFDTIEYTGRTFGGWQCSTSWLICMSGRLALYSDGITRHHLSLSQTVKPSLSEQHEQQQQ